MLKRKYARFIPVNTSFELINEFMRDIKSCSVVVALALCYLRDSRRRVTVGKLARNQPCKPQKFALCNILAVHRYSNLYCRYISPP